jgi:diguanylate cyclase (GGDEF)-like protein
MKSSAATFRLTRYFSVVSLIGLLPILFVLVMSYRHFAFQALEDHETQDNRLIAQVFSSSLWPTYAAYVSSASNMAKDQLQHSPQTASLRADVVRQMSGLSVVKVKIYNLQGLTVFSTDATQIGEDKSKNAGFLSARSGQSISEITFRQRFDAFEQVINDRNLVSSYVPIQNSAGSRVEGVMEVYSDVTGYVAKLEQTTWSIFGIALFGTATLYLFLLVIVRRADDHIELQRIKIKEANAREIAYQATHDPMTGLPNRTGFTERVENLVARSQKNTARCAVLCIEMDGIEHIRSTLGFGASDLIVGTAAQRLVNGLAQVEIVGIDGWNFLVAVYNPLIELGIDHIVSYAEKAGLALNGDSYSLHGHQFVSTTSIGISVFPDDAKDAPSLIRAALVAQSYCRKKGGNGYQFHIDKMNSQALELMAMDRDLRLAIHGNQFVLHYQPQVDFDGKVIGGEALIRWNHPDKGLVFPGAFIAIAEDRGLIGAIGSWVLNEACRQSKEWVISGLTGMSVSVNVSAIQFQQSGFVNEVTDMLHAHGLDPQYLELELTERVFLQEDSSATQIMQQLNALGVQISLDDFGTGYSSLSQVKRLPLHKLKIDQSFVRELETDSDDRAIAAAIVAMGKALGLTVIAEGVETPEQMGILRKIGCDQLQGYLVARPLTALDFAKFAAQAPTPEAPRF